MNSPHALRTAARVLRHGGLVLHPTEGVWGIACDPLNARSVLRLCAAKQRPLSKGLILVASSAGDLRPFVADDERGRQALARARDDWPGPVTWVCPASAALPWWLAGAHEGVALRVSAHAGVRALVDAFGGPLVSTSANLAGRPPARHAWQARRQLGRKCDYLLAGELSRPGKPSQIRSALTQQVLRS